MDLEEIVNRLLQLISQRLAERQIQTDLQLESHVALVCDPAQIHQVLLNLTLNAIEAMDEIKIGRRLGITIYRKDNQAVILVSNTGSGIPKDKCEQLFDPFYTTKISGGGLGLSILQTIVLHHGGSVAVESEPGQGATFRVVLPINGPTGSGEVLQ